MERGICEWQLDLEIEAIDAERKRRSGREGQELDQVELQELESEESQLRRRQMQEKGDEELERELQLARDWVNRDLNLRDRGRLGASASSLKSWQRLVNLNRPVPFLLITAKGERDLCGLEEMHWGLNEAKARLEEHQARDATRLEEASSNWTKLNPWRTNGLPWTRRRIGFR